MRNTGVVPNPPADVTVLRALAHPVRNRILAELSAQGSLRAADVARELGIPANQASFHLRSLAKYGLVEEDPDAARDKRDRVWRAVSEDGQDINLGLVEEQPGGKAASRVFRSRAAAFGHRLVDDVYDERRDQGTRRTVVEQAVRLTRDEAAELSDELSALAARWGERTRGRDDTRSTYSFFAIVQPYPVDGPDQPEQGA